MSWKQYGGIRKNDKINNMGIGTIVADDIILRQVKVTTHIFDDTIVAKKDIKIHRNLDVSQNVDISGDLVVHQNIYGLNYVLNTNRDISLNIEKAGGFRSYISSDIYKDCIGIGTNKPYAFVDISSVEIDSFAIRNNQPYIRNILTQNQNNSGIVLDTNGDTAGIRFFHRDVSNTNAVPISNIIVDTSDSTLTLDSSFNNITSRNTTTITSELSTNITTHNGDISMNAESIYITSLSGEVYVSSENSTSIISISGDIDISSNEGNITISSNDATRMRSAVRISERDTILNLKNEPLTIYDNAQSTPFVYDYYNNNSLTTGHSSVHVAIDNSSTTFSHLLTPDTKGLSIGGGAHVYDISRSMGFIGLATTDASFLPVQTCVSNPSAVLYRTTMGVNTYAPRMNKYVMDVNGPMRIGNGELHPMVYHSSKITSIKSSREYPEYIFAGGRREKTKGADNLYPTYVFASMDAGESWKKVNVDEYISVRTNDMFVHCTGKYAYTLTSDTRVNRYNFEKVATDGTVGFVDLYNRKFNYIISGGIYVKHFDNDVVDPLMITIGRKSTANTSNNNRIFFTRIDNSFNELSAINISSSSADISLSSVNIANSAQINGADFKDIDGFGDSVYTVGNVGIVYFNINEFTAINTPQLHIEFVDNQYNTVSAFDISNAVVAGENSIMHTIDGGKTWTPDKVYINDEVYSSGFNIKKVSMLKDGRGVAIGTYTKNNMETGIILYTLSGTSEWKDVPNDRAFYSFGNEDVLRSPSINDFCISANGAFAFTNVTTDVSNSGGEELYNSGSSTIYYGKYPALFDIYNNNVLDVNGGMKVNGQILQF